MVLAAVTGKADYLVAADNDLLVVRDHHEVRILNPAEFDEIVQAC